MRAFRDPSLRFLIGATALTAMAAGGALLLGDDSPPSSDSVEAPPSTEPPVEESVEESEGAPVEMSAEVTCPGADADLSVLRSCLSPSLVFVSTPATSGTGVLLHNGLIVTNAHVVDPYERVDIRFVGGDRFDDVPVVGIDMAADIAVLDLVDVDRGPGITMAALPSLEDLDRSDLFLVGFPGGLERSGPEIALTRGVFSRFRYSEPFEQVWLQSDASIVGGQSGGALVDGNGRLLGISGYSYAGLLSFSLSVDDVIEAVERINTGQVPEWASIAVPGEVREAPTEVEFPAADTVRTIMLPAADSERTVHLTVDSVGFDVDVYTASGLQIGSASVARPGDESFSDDLGGIDTGFGNDWFEEDLELYGYGGSLDVADDDEISFVLPAGEAGVVDIFRDRRGTVDVTLDVPYRLVDASRDAGEVVAGETVRGHVDTLGGVVVHEIDLERGDRLIADLVGAPINPTLNLLPPFENPLEVVNRFAFYGGESLGFIDELRPHEYEITRSGTFQLVISSSIPAEYELTVDVE